MKGVGWSRTSTQGSWADVQNLESSYTPMEKPRHL